MNMDNTSLNNQLFPNGGLFYTILSTMTDVFTRELLRKYFEKLSIKISTDDCSVPENQNIVEKGHLYTRLVEEKINEITNLIHRWFEKRDVTGSKSLFYGPPGTGKTSIMHNISHLLRRNCKSYGLEYKRIFMSASLLRDPDYVNNLFKQIVSWVNSGYVVGLFLDEGEVLFKKKKDHIISIILTFVNELQNLERESVERVKKGLPGYGMFVSAISANSYELGASVLRRYTMHVNMGILDPIKSSELFTKYLKKSTILMNNYDLDLLNINLLSELFGHCEILSQSDLENIVEKIEMYYLLYKTKINFNNLVFIVLDTLITYLKQQLTEEQVATKIKGILKELQDSMIITDLTIDDLIQSMTVEKRKIPVVKEFFTLLQKYMKISLIVTETNLNILLKCFNLKTSRLTNIIEKLRDDPDLQNKEIDLSHIFKYCLQEKINVWRKEDNLSQNTINNKIIQLKSSLCELIPELSL